jgi:poly(3-hydroxybutyrate) depolymerase
MIFQKQNDATPSECDGTDCTPCPVVIGFHGYGESGSSPNSWKSRLEAKGAAAGFISLYPTGDNTTPSSYLGGMRPNWAVPSCMDPDQIFAAGYSNGALSLGRWRTG